MGRFGGRRADDHMGREIVGESKRLEVLIK